MTEGDPGLDIWGMDVARYGDYATLAYTNAKVRENYSRRFRITFPNEELPGGAAAPHDPGARPPRPAQRGVGRRRSASSTRSGSNGPAAEPLEDVTFRRSNAFPLVAEECQAVRERVGLTETSNFAKYRVSGPGAAGWLQGLFTNRLPKVGRIVLTPMLNPQGRIVGEFSVARIGDDDFFLFGSQAAETHHSRWFLDHLPADGSVGFRMLALSLVGLSVAGPHARDVLQSLTRTSLATADFPFMAFRRDRHRHDPGLGRAHDLQRRPGLRALGRARGPAGAVRRCSGRPGEPYGMRLFGFRALMSLRMEKSFGTWFREYRPIYTPLEAGMDRYLKLDHDFIGRAALEAEMAPRARTAAGHPRRRAPRRGAGRRDRRRADLARRPGRRLGDVGRVRAPQRALAGARLRAGCAGRARRCQLG